MARGTADTKVSALYRGCVRGYLKRRGTGDSTHAKISPHIATAFYWFCSSAYPTQHRAILERSRISTTNLVLRLLVHKTHLHAVVVQVSATSHLRHGVQLSERGQVRRASAQGASATRTWHHVSLQSASLGSMSSRQIGHWSPGYASGLTLRANGTSIGPHQRSPSSMGLRPTPNLEQF